MISVVFSLTTIFDDDVLTTLLDDTTLVDVVSALCTTTSGSVGIDGPRLLIKYL
jgi:hypothetical protein